MNVTKNVDEIVKIVFNNSESYLVHWFHFINRCFWNLGTSVVKVHVHLSYLTHKHTYPICIFFNLFLLN